MKVLLVGNYLPDRQNSMQIYASMLEAGMRARGHEVRLLQPPAILGPRVAADSPLFKWLGYADKFLLFRRELRRAAEGADIVHLCDHSNAMYVPALAHSAHIITCHDVLAIRSAMRHFPENRVRLTGRMFQRLIARGLRRAHAIVCVSGKTCNDLKQYLAVPEERLHVVPNALHWPYKPVSADVCAPLLASVGLRRGEPYFFHLGGNHWYKNRGAAIEIFAELRDLPAYAGAKLVMAGSRMEPELHAIAQKYRLDDAVLEAVGLSNEQLEALYSCALALLFPSLEEGFGWPILEAQACGCPVVTTDRPPMNDVAGGAAILIDPAKPKVAARTIADALEDTSQMRSDGLRNAARYTTDRMLAQCEALYLDVVTAARMRK
ncbi:MAG TPA: glycosyltransferase family 1 protein [Acidobacteriaceae bacterium]|jgi:glycosyltransferase involved in cell wall biosynthesis